MASLEDLFTRFRETGDPVPLGGVFDRAAPRLLRVALHLAPDPAAAEDLVQATFLSALERAHAFDARRPLLPWLHGILARHARKARAAARRTAPATEAVPPDGGDPAREAERREMVALVRDHVERLPEVYRGVLLLRLQHGLAPAEIAEVLGLPAGTVRMRLHRGAERLRRTLPSGVALLALPLLLPVRGLAAVRTAVLSHAAVSLPAAAALGGAVLMKKMLAAVAVVLALALVWTLGPGSAADGEPRPGPEVVPPVGAAVAERVPEPRDDTIVSTRRSVSPDLAAAAPLPTGALRVRVVTPEGRPVPMVGLAVQAFDGRDPLLHAHRAATGPDGTVSVEEIAAGTVSVLLDRGVHTLVDVAPGGWTEHEIEVPAGITVLGEVRDGDGHGVPFAEISVREHGRDGAMQYVGRTDATGAFRLEALQPGCYVGARAPGHAPCRGEPVEGDPGAVQRVVLALREAAARVRGLVLDDAGRPVRGALVLGGGESGGRQLRVREDRCLGGWVPSRVRTECDGTFVLDALPEGEIELTVHAAGHAPLSRYVRLHAGATNDVTLRLTAGAALRGRVLGENGEPVAGAHVRVEAFGLHAVASTLCTAEGRFDLRGLDAARIALAVRADGYRPYARELRGAPGEALEHIVVLRRAGVLRGRLVGPDGAPLAGWGVWLPGSGLPLVQADAEGRFTAHGGPLAHAMPWIRPDVAHGHGRIACDWLGALALGAEDTSEIEIRVPAARMPTASLRGRLVDVCGEPPKRTWVRIEQDGQVVGAAADVDPKTGAFAFEAVVPGSYEVSWRASSSREPPFPWGTVELAPGEALDLGELCGGDGGSAEPGFLHVRLRRTDGVPIEDPSVFVYDGHGRELQPLFTGLLARARQKLLPGRYEVYVMSANAQWVRRPFTIESGADTTLDLALAPATRRYLFFPWPVPDGWEHVQRVAFVVRDAAGAVVDEGELAGDEIPFRYMPGLGLGPHRLELETDDGRAYAGAFGVDDLGKSHVPIVVAVEPAGAPR